MGVKSPKGRSARIAQASSPQGALDKAARFAKTQPIIAATAVLTLVAALWLGPGMLRSEPAPKPRYKSKRASRSQRNNGATYSGSLGSFIRFTEEDYGESDAPEPKAALRATGSDDAAQRGNGQININAFIRATDLEKMSAADAEAKVQTEHMFSLSGTSCPWHLLFPISPSLAPPNV